MQCVDCRFWAHVPDEALDKDRRSMVGECRRNAPKPDFETAWVMREAQRQAFVAGVDETAPEPDGEMVERWSSRMALWPVTWAVDFCGEFAERP